MSHGIIVLVQISAFYDNGEVYSKIFKIYQRQYDIFLKKKHKFGTQLYDSNHENRNIYNHFPDDTYITCINFDGVVCESQKKIIDLTEYGFR